MVYEISIPENLNFQDYIAIIQTARTWADGQDKKDPERLLAAVAPEVEINYTFIVPAWGTKTYKAADYVAKWLAPEMLGLKAMATQHLLAAPYFLKATADEILVEWQNMASHGRRQPDSADSFGEKIGETADGKGYVEHRFNKIDGVWKITMIKPSVLFMDGDFDKVRQP